MWLRAHPFTPFVGGAVALIVVGWLIVSSRVAVEMPRDVGTWGGAGGIDLSSLTATRNSFPKKYADTASYAYDPLLPTLSDSPGEEPASEDDAIALLLASIRPSSYPIADAEDTSFLDEIYGLVPQGLRVVSEPRELSDEEHALYEYGNEVGSYVETYEESYGRRAVPVLREFYADRTSNAKQEGVRQLGEAIVRIGEGLREMMYVPEELKAMHDLLSERFLDVGEKLAAFPDARDDSDLLERITAYNAAADGLAVAITTLAVFFATAEISFSSYDPGSLFTFSPAAGLE